MKKIKVSAIFVTDVILTVSLLIAVVVLACLTSIELAMIFAVYVVIPACVIDTIIYAIGLIILKVTGRLEVVTIFEEEKEA